MKTILLFFFICLGGNGSHIVITAGTAYEESYGVEEWSVVTHALISALKNERYANEGLLTIDQAFGELRSTVAWFNARYKKKMTPKMWDDIDKDYNETFIFIDSGIKEKDFARTYEESLNIVPKGKIRIETIRHCGNISIDVKTGGQLYLGDTLMKMVPSLSTTIIEELSTGDYTVIMCYADGHKEAYKVTVQKDTTVQVKFLYVPMEIPDWLVFVEGGTFQMESGFSIKSVWKETVKSFYIGKYEVTQEEYLKFCNTTKINYPVWLEVGNQYNIHTGADMHYKPHVGPGKEKHPIIGISWYNAIAYCNWLSEQEGINPCYSKSSDTIVCDFNSNGYRLPTQVEWEIAARGGIKSKGFEYSGSSYIDYVAWYKHNSGGTTHPVGQKHENELGIYNMSGNVWEWCWDLFIPDTGGSGYSWGRVYRGGCWESDERRMHSTYWFWDDPNYCSRCIGFRLVRSF